MVPDVTGEITEYRGVTGTPRGVNGPSWALVEERRQQPRVGCAPLGPNRIGWGGGLSFFSLSFFLLLLLPLGKEGVLLLVGVGLSLGRTLVGRPSPPPLLLYILRQGAPNTHKLIIDLLAVCGAPL